MQQANIHEVRENLAEYLVAVERGDEVLICRRNQPVARLVGIERPPLRKPRPIGKADDAGVALPDAFYEPLPVALLAALSGVSAVADPLETPTALAAAKPAPVGRAAARPRR